MPSRLHPIFYILLAEIVLFFGVASHVIRHIDDKSHRAEHMSMKPQPPAGWQMAIEENGKVTYLREHKRTYATQRQYQRMMAGK